MQFLFPEHRTRNIPPTPPNKTPLEYGLNGNVCSTFEQKFRMRTFIFFISGLQHPKNYMLNINLYTLPQPAQLVNDVFYTKL